MAPKAGSSSKTSSKWPPKQIKQVSVQDKISKKWKSIKDQIANGYPENALKNCSKILALEAGNLLAQQTYIQLLLMLDRYKEALDFITSDQTRQDRWKVEHAYALYKLGNEYQAGQLLSKIREGSATVDDDAARTLDVVEAQIKYRLEEFSDAQMLYEDLISIVEPDSPEYADLSTNLSACNAQLDFIASIPSLLGDLSSSHDPSKRIPPIDVLENNPIAVQIAAHPAYRNRPNATQAASTAIKATQAGQASSSTLPAKKAKSKSAPTKARKLPKHIADMPEDKRPPLDTERWLPKRERKNFAEYLAVREREKEKKKLKARKKLEAAMTQGSATAVPEQSKQSSNNASQQKKKKKAKK